MTEIAYLKPCGENTMTASIDETVFHDFDPRAPVYKNKTFVDDLGCTNHNGEQMAGIIDDVYNSYLWTYDLKDYALLNDNEECAVLAGSIASLALSIFVEIYGIDSDCPFIENVREYDGEFIVGLCGAISMLCNQAKAMVEQIESKNSKKGKKKKCKKSH